MKQAHDDGQPFSFILMDEHLSGFETLAVEIAAFRPKPGVVLLRQAGWPGDSIGPLLSSDSISVSKPVQESDLIAVIVSLATPAPPSQKEVQSSAPIGQHLHLLLAEDNEVNQKLALALLKKQGHTVTVASNGREAVALAVREPFDAVLMDIQMPEMSGLEAAQAIRQLESHGQVAASGGRKRGQPLPIIAMTAHVMNGDRERCMQAGMNGYVSKPIQPDLLFSTLKELSVAEEESEINQNTPMVSDRKDNDAAEFSGEGPPIYDRSSALRRTGGDEALLFDLMELFSEDYPKQLRRIKDAMESGDHPAVQHLAHALKGTIGNFAAARAFKAAGRLEEIAATQDLVAVEGAFGKLEEELERLN
jgi:CheY-like chemotaxis protein/HPt (histidine-containing phosphotransfer) domain-containing protein